MGIKNLSKILNDDAPSSVKEESLAELMGRKIAIDASMAIYQFLVAVRSSDGGGAATQLTNEAGEVTSHIQGMWNRTIRMLESGIKPAYVFDGKPPVMKGQELKKRSDAKAKAQADLKAATEAGVVEDMDKFSKRTVHMTGDHIADCKRLLQLMGVPVISAPCEAEAQCAELCKAGKVYAAASEDTDTITFGAPKVIRRLAFSEARKLPILEYDFTKVLEGLELTHPQFIDLCILCGCDYCDNIKGIGPKTALKLIRTHGDIEGVLAHIDAMPTDKCKYSVPDEFRELFAEARKLFSHADVTSGSEIDLKWTDCDEEGLKTFLVAEKGFNVDRVERGIQKIKKAKKQGSQMRMDSFFSVVPKAAQPAKRKAAGGGGKKPTAKKQKGKK